MSEDVSGDTPDLLTHAELREYRSALQDFTTTLRAHGAAAMDLADKMTAVQELSKMRTDAHKKVLKVIGKVAKSRGLDPDSISDVNLETGMLVLK